MTGAQATQPPLKKVRGGVPSHNLPPFPTPMRVRVCVCVCVCVRVQKGNTSLHIASLAGHVDVVQVLLQHGAQVNLQSTVSLHSLIGVIFINHQPCNR